MNAIRRRRIDAALRLPLSRLENGERDPFVDEHLQRLGVDRGLGKPHPFRLASESRLEIANAPAHLRPFVARVRQRQDHVVVDLRDRGAVSLEAVAADAIGIDDGVIRLGRACLEPGDERRPDVEVDGRVVVDDAEDAVARIEDSRRRVRRVALGGDALVPVVIRVRRVLRLDRFQPRILARRLIEVAVNGDETPFRHQAANRISHA